MNYKLNTFKYQKDDNLSSNQCDDINILLVFNQLDIQLNFLFL